MRGPLSVAALAAALVLTAGCQPEPPKAAGQGGSPPPVNSNADKLKTKPPAAPKGLAPPKKGGGPAAS